MAATSVDTIGSSATTNPKDIQAWPAMVRGYYDSLYVHGPVVKTCLPGQDRRDSMYLQYGVASMANLGGHEV